MSAIYIESSVVLSWLLEENLGHKAASLLESAAFICTSRLTLIESRRSLLRHETHGSLKPSERQKALGQLEKVISDWHLMEITLQVEKRASQSFPIEPIRSLDAIHLATALEWLQIQPQLKIASFDRRILENLEPLGLIAAL